MGELFMLLCVSRSKGIALWWGPERRGYTTDVNSAGRYTVEDTRAIVGQSEDVVAVPVSAIGGELTTRQIVDLGDGLNRDVINRMKE